MFNAIKNKLNQFAIKHPFASAFISTFFKVGTGVAIGLCVEKYAQHCREVEPFRGLTTPFDRDKKRLATLVNSMETLKPKNTWMFRCDDNDEMKVDFAFYRDTKFEYIDGDWENGIAVVNNLANKEED